MSFRQITHLLFFLRILYLFYKVKYMARRIVITSGKGGVGKTTVCVNLGTQLSKMGKKVLIVDADFGLNNLDIVMGIENKIVYDIYDIIQGKCRARQAIVNDFFNDNLYVLPATKCAFKPAITNESLKGIIDEVDTHFDYVLFDCPAGVDNGFLRAVCLAYEAIIVTTPHISAVRDAEKVCNILKTMGIDILNIVINRARGDLMISGESLSITSIVDFLDAKLIGVVPEDDEINNQLLVGGEVTTGSQAYISFKKIAKMIVYGKEDIYDVMKKYKGAIGLIRRKLKKII